MKKEIENHHNSSLGLFLKVYRQAADLGISIKDTRKILEENYPCLERIFLNEPLSVMNALDELKKDDLDLSKIDVPKKVSDKIFASKYRNYNPYLSLFAGLDSPFNDYF